MEWLVALWQLVVHYWPIVGISFVVPFVVGGIAKTNWSKTAKTWVAFLVSIGAGALGSLVVGIVPSPETLPAFVASVFAIAQLTYPILKKYELTAGWLDKLLAWRSAAKPQVLQE